MIGGSCYACGVGVVELRMSSEGSMAVALDNEDDDEVDAHDEPEDDLE